MFDPQNTFQVSLAALAKGFERIATRPNSQENQPMSNSPIDKVSITNIGNPQESRLFFGYGILRGEKAPGGTGAARAVAIDGTVVAQSKGTIFDFSRITAVQKMIAEKLERTEQPEKPEYNVEQPEPPSSSQQQTAISLYQKASEPLSNSATFSSIPLAAETYRTNSQATYGVDLSLDFANIEQ